jgi:hypothetical protein
MGKPGKGKSGEPNDTTLRCKNTASRSPRRAKNSGFTTAYLQISDFFGVPPEVFRHEICRLEIFIAAVNKI